MKKLLFLVNPTAGQRKIVRNLAEVIGIFNDGGYEVTTYVTAYSGHCIEIVQDRAADHDIVVCAGGDGTLNETITGILRSGADIPIGYIPAGSTNDFAASLNLPSNVLQAAQAIMEGVPTSYDVGQFGQRYFSYVASFGAFTRVSYSTPQNVKNSLGHLAYLLESIQEISKIRKTHVRFELDGETIEDDYIFGSISNSTSVGGVLTLDPKQVDMADGKFELLLVRMPKDTNELRDLLQALNTQQYDCGVLTFRNVSDLTIYPDPNMPWTLDGEKEDGHECVRITNLRHAIRLIRRKESQDA